MTQRGRTRESMSLGRRDLARTFFTSLIGDVSSKLGLLVTTLIAVRSLAPWEFGQFVGLSATALVAASVWDVGVSPLLTREVAAERVPIVAGLLKAIRLRVTALGLWLAAFGLGTVILTRSDSPPLLAILAFGAGSFAFGTHTLTLAILRGRLLFGTAAAIVATGRWLTAGVSFLALEFGIPGERLVLFALAFVAGESLILALSTARAVLYTSRSIAQEGTVSSLNFRAALPFAANGILGMAYNRFDVVLVAALTTPHQLGLYATASRIQDALYLLPSSLNMIALPVMAGAWKQGYGLEEIQRLVRLLGLGGLTLALVLVALIFVVAPDIVPLVFGVDYGEAITPTRILIFFLPFGAITAPLLAAMAGVGRATDTTWVFLVAFLVAIVMHVALVPWWGANGAAVASLSRDPAAVLTAAMLAKQTGVLFQRRPIRDAGIAVSHSETL